MSHSRVERVGDLLRRELARVLREETRDPRIGFVTLTDVRVSPDLRYATVFVTLLDLDGPQREQALAVLNRATPFLRRSLARGLELRYTPELRFVYDDSLDRGLRVDELLAEPGGAPEPADPDDDPSHVG